MSNFEAAVELSLNNWVDSFPTEFDLPQPTESYKKGIAKLMDKMRGDRYHKLTRSAARAILIAAIIMAIATVTIAATVGRDFIVQKFHDYSTYSVIDSSGVKDVEDIHIGYIPEGFKLTYKDTSNAEIGCVYERKSNWINVYKAKIDHDLTFDSEHENSFTIFINGYKSVYYENPNLSFAGIVFNNGNYVFRIEGNLTKEQLIKVAENIS